MKKNIHRLVALLFFLLTPAIARQAQLPAYPHVVPGYKLDFPGDHGAHPDFRTEWWYVTGWVHTASGTPLGFQVTFFRSRPQLDQSNPSRFAPTQLIFAHAAVSDPALGRLQHAQRAARAGFGLAEAKKGDTSVYIDNWSLRRDPDGTYRTLVDAKDFTLELMLEPTQPLLLQGKGGFSQKGPLPAQSSYYYSQPQLKVRGTLVRNNKQESIQGTAWLDHEWSSEVLAEQAVGWDWTGINLDDGGSLMVFQIRDKAGKKFWAGGTLRHADGNIIDLPGSAIVFKPKHSWRSPRTNTEYPISVHIHAGKLLIELVPLMSDQELDSRASTGAVYWEGAVTALQDAKSIGHGYLELTGYFQPIGF